MAVLGNPRHERAAQTLAAGGSAEAAAAAAEYDTKASSFAANARKLIRRSDIRERVKELQGQIADKVVDVTGDRVKEVLWRIASVKLEDADIDAGHVIAAARELAKILGIYAPTKVAPTNPAGDGPMEGSIVIELVDSKNGAS